MKRGVFELNYWDIAEVPDEEGIYRKHPARLKMKWYWSLETRPISKADHSCGPDCGLCLCFGYGNIRSRRGICGKRVTKKK